VKLGQSGEQLDLQSTFILEENMWDYNIGLIRISIHAQENEKEETLQGAGSNALISTVTENF